MLTSESDLVIYHCKSLQAVSLLSFHTYNTSTSVLILLVSCDNNQWSLAENENMTAHKTKLCEERDHANFGGASD